MLLLTNIRLAHLAPLPSQCLIDLDATCLKASVLVLENASGVCASTHADLSLPLLCICLFLPLQGTGLAVVTGLMGQPTRRESVACR